ncbi:hypothetical protein, partial [Kitasatospora sp. MBT63]|uniref:hypothetical protein n=1 Tax=Kitasatospora sp. MBT63 TaxID=1444768 RepID=UPI0005396B92
MSLTAGTHTITALPDGAKGLSYAAPALNATGGTGTYRWTRTTGNLTRGQTVTYTVTNTGPAKAAGVQVGAAFTGLNTTG